jgi:hypothetical protein
MIRKEIIEKPSRKNKYTRLEIKSGSELSNKSKSGMFNTSSINIERITSLFVPFFHRKTICFTAKFYFGYTFNQ